MYIAHCDHTDKSIGTVESHVKSDGIIMCDLCRSNTEITWVIAVCNVQSGLKTLKWLYQQDMHMEIQYCISTHNWIIASVPAAFVRGARGTCTHPSWDTFILLFFQSCASPHANCLQWCSFCTLSCVWCVTYQHVACVVVPAWNHRTSGQRSAQ